MHLWAINEKGFLPTTAPLASLPIANYKHTKLVFIWENLCSNLPNFQKDRIAREEIVCSLRTQNNYYDEFIDHLGSQREHERAFLIFNYFALGYLNAGSENRHTQLPKEISIPLNRCAFLVNRKPVLDFASYFLYNWRQAPGGIQALLTFTDSADEKRFIASIVALEIILSPVVKERFNLNVIYRVLQEANQFVASIELNPDNLRRVADYFTDLQDVKYQVVDEKPKFYSCNLVAQSPSLQLICKILGVVFKDEHLYALHTQALGYMPAEHAQVVKDTPSFRPKLVAHPHSMRTYNGCLIELAKLTEYLFKLESNPEVNNLRKQEVLAYCV